MSEYLNGLPGLIQTHVIATALYLLLIFVMICLAYYVQTHPVSRTTSWPARIGRVIIQGFLGVTFVFFFITLAMLSKGMRFEDESEHAFFLWAFAAFGFIAGVVIGVVTDYDNRSED